MIFQGYSQTHSLVNRVRESGNYRSSGQWQKTNLKELREEVKCYAS